MSVRKRDYVCSLLTLFCLPGEYEDEGDRREREQNQAASARVSQPPKGILAFSPRCLAHSLSLSFSLSREPSRVLSIQFKGLFWHYLHFFHFFLTISFIFTHPHFLSLQCLITIPQCSHTIAKARTGSLPTSTLSLKQCVPLIVCYRKCWC